MCYGMYRCYSKRIMQFYGAADLRFWWSQTSACFAFQPQNILLTSKSPLGDIKIVDFGLSRIVKSSEELREIMGTPEYVGKLFLQWWCSLKEEGTVSNGELSQNLMNATLAV